MSETYRVRVRRGDTEVEVESSDKQFVEDKVNQYLGASGSMAQEAKHSPEPTSPSVRRRPLSLGEFVRQVNPEKKGEVAATLAYFLEYHAETLREEWKPDEVASKFTDVRKSKPANMTDLLVKSSLFMEGRDKGSYRLSETGVRWVEGRLGDAL